MSSWQRIIPLLLLLACGPPERSWQVHPDGVGPLRFGMSLDQVGNTLGTTLSDSVPRVGCAYWRPPGAPSGLSFMVEDGKLVRADIDSSGVPSSAGVEVGSSETAARDAYHDQLTVQPHKYRWEEGWRYLVHQPKDSDSLHATVFESDGQIIRSYRVGLRPQVEYVERCG